MLLTCSLEKRTLISVWVNHVSAFQVRKSLSSSLIALNISGGAHHLDLRYNKLFAPWRISMTFFLITKQNLILRFCLFFSCRGSNDADPVSVISARKTEADLIAHWVKMERTRLRKSLWNSVWVYFLSNHNSFSRQLWRKSGWLQIAQKILHRKYCPWVYLCALTLSCTLTVVSWHYVEWMCIEFICLNIFFF